MTSLSDETHNSERCSLVRPRSSGRQTMRKSTVESMFDRAQKTVSGHAATNAYLDELALCRRAGGLPAGSSLTLGPEVRGDGVPVSDWFVVWRAFRIDQRLDAFDEEICNCRRAIPDMDAGDHAVADVPGDESNEGGGGLGDQAETGGPLLPDFTRRSHGLNKHADSVSWAQRPYERTPKHQLAANRRR